MFGVAWVLPRTVGNYWWLGDWDMKQEKMCCGNWNVSCFCIFGWKWEKGTEVFWRKWKSNGESNYLFFIPSVIERILHVIQISGVDFFESLINTQHKPWGDVNKSTSTYKKNLVSFTVKTWNIIHMLYRFGWIFFESLIYTQYKSWCDINKSILTYKENLVSITMKTRSAI